jgi:uncharacterized protein (DUF302 family)
MKKTVLLLILGLCFGVCRAELPGVLHWTLELDLESAYKNIYNSLEENNLFVVFEPDIGKNLAGFSARWGADYNRNQLQGIRAMVFCNGWYANQVSNLDPELLALCPLHITLYRQDDITHVVFVRPTHVGMGSVATKLMEELEAKVKTAVEAGINVAQPSLLHPP